MPVHLTWGEIALRLALTIAAAAVVGFNRSEHGKVAGMRTTVLVCLAASVAMIQVNLLLPTAGRPTDSFVMNDLMRLPLGILTGVGFIGGGAILRRDNILVGVTTAATLWMITVIGLCLGGGQIGLGLGATALALLSLWALGVLENHMSRASRARLALVLDSGGPSQGDIQQRLSAAGLTVIGVRRARYKEGEPCELEFELREVRKRTSVRTPDVLTQLANSHGVRTLVWEAGV